MSTTVKKIHLCLTKADIELLENLEKYYCETRTAIIRRAIQCLSFNVNDINKLKLREKK